jgi:hypothetical protein
MRLARRTALLIALALAIPALDASIAAAQSDNARYELANGCYALRSQPLGSFVAKTGDGHYAASVATVGEAEPLRMKATELGQYMLYGRDGDYVARGSQTDPINLVPGTPPNRVESASEPSAAADWRVDVAGPGTFRIVLPAADGQVLATAGEGGDLVLADPGSAGDAALFAFEPASGCREYPEPEVNVTGDPRTGTTSFTEVRGLVDAHIHMMAFEFLGGGAHCGRPWHRYGVTVALVDCPDHGPDGRGAVLENVLWKDPAHGHDTVGWPTFRDWPHPKSLTHEQTYYTWLERAWRGGLRIYVNLLVDNAVLCELYPIGRRNSCNEMDGVRLQARRLRELENYIDAQNGGPGKGWFRIVDDPFEARRVINEGKLAVVQGIEVSKLFDCGETNDNPECTREQIDRRLDEVYDLGVRDMELVNKFDNALSGVAGDSGDTGLVTNQGNRYETGEYWDMQTCNGPPGAEDRPQHAAPGTGRDQLVANVIFNFLPQGLTPIYPEAPHCNTEGLTDLGEHLVRRMIDKKMLIDPDHMSASGRNELLSIVEAERYSGVVSSHSWSSPDATPRIYDVGGFITPYAGDSEGFVKQWRETKAHRNPRYFFGFGYGADMNGFGAQGDPRGPDVPNPVRYPFKSFDGRMTIDKQRSGERVYDINVDGVAHYGLYPDWLEDLRMLAGQEIVEDMARGPEAYLQTWERAEGVARRRCQPARSAISRTGIGHVRLGASTQDTLFRAGQPKRRVGRSYRHCLNRRGKRKRGKMGVVFTPAGRSVLIATSGPNQRTTRRVGPGMKAPKRARRLGGGLRTRRAGKRSVYVFGVKRGRVKYMAVASRSVARSERRLRRHLRLAGFR